jgi:acyl carrier protein
MNHYNTMTHGRIISAAEVEQVVIDALRASSDKSAPVSRETDVLQVVDSLGLMMSVANIQTALNIKLEPREVIGVLQSRSVADLGLVLITALKSRGELSA